MIIFSFPIQNQGIMFSLLWYKGGTSHESTCYIISDNYYNIHTYAYYLRNRNVLQFLILSIRMQKQAIENSNLQVSHTHNRK